MLHNIYLEFPKLTLETQCLLVSTPSGLTTCFIEATPNEQNAVNSLLAHYYRLLADHLENKTPLNNESLGNIYLGHNGKYNWHFLNVYPESITLTDEPEINWHYSEIKLIP